MENKEVIKHKKISKFDWVNIILISVFTSCGLWLFVGGIQQIIDNDMSFIRWFWFFIGGISFFMGILFSILDLIKSIKNKKKNIDKGSDK
ncbi:MULTISPECIES: hypothetical protein [Spiroplasma]|uniref:hypothetical protein n=1 Tax=Spiroplasma TaxID=2132 RepID=UPI00157B0330|nr:MULTISPECIES: hypothetical protein [Spiroplasma]WJG70555.1 hypothetical protein SIXOD_v1c17460 [Spiroplasma ixodetis Y32]